MLPVSLIFTSGVASGVNSYAAVLVLGLLGRFGHIAAIPQVLERPPVLAAAAVLYIGQFVVGKIPMLDSVWDIVHTALRPVVGGAIGVVMAQQAGANSATTIAAAALGGGSALASHVVKLLIQFRNCLPCSSVRGRLFPRSLLLAYLHFQVDAA